MNDNMKKLWAKDVFRESYFIVRLTDTHNKVIKELHLKNKWKFKWFMLFKKNREKYHNLYNIYLFEKEGKPIKFNMTGNIDETTNQ